MQEVAQGDPLSAVLFNLAIDDIINELEYIKAACGYNAHNDVTSVLSFADDTGIVGKDCQSVQQLVNIASSGFARYGLRLNASKTHGLVIVGGRPYYRADTVFSNDAVNCENGNQLSDEDEEAATVPATNETVVYRRNIDVLELKPIILNGQDRQPIDHHNVARYLGAIFAPTQMFDRNIARSSWCDQFERLIATEHLRGGQKLQMVQQYLHMFLTIRFK